MFKSFILITILLSGMISGIAHATDSKSAWSGFHMGISAGSHKTNNQTVNISGSNVIKMSQPGSVPYSLSLDRDKSFGAILGGYSWQSGVVVYGLEADYTFTDLKDDNRLSKLGGNAVTTVSLSVKNLTTLRGRIGYTPSSRWLLALTGGLAAARVKTSGNVDEFSGTGRQFNASDSSYKIGWVLGLQANYALTKNLKFRGDYSHYDLGSTDNIRGYQTQPSDATQFADYNSVKINGNLYSLSLIYQF